MWLVSRPPPWSAVLTSVYSLIQRIAAVVASQLPAGERLWSEAREALGSSSQAKVTICQGKSCCKAGSAEVWKVRGHAESKFETKQMASCPRQSPSWICSTWHKADLLKGITPSLTLTCLAYWDQISATSSFHTLLHKVWPDPLTYIVLDTPNLGDFVSKFVLRHSMVDFSLEMVWKAGTAIERVVKHLVTLGKCI